MKRRHKFGIWTISDRQKRIIRTKLLDDINTFKFKILKKSDYWQWNTVAMAAKIAQCAIDENGERTDATYLGRYCSAKYLWLASRLKFTNEKAINLLKDFYNFNKKHYTETIDDKETIYETMKRYGICYPEAVFYQFEGTLNSKYNFWFGPFHESQFYLPDKLRYSNLSEDGKTIVYYDPKDEPPQPHELRTEEEKAAIRSGIDKKIKKLKAEHGEL
jgi:hypothetical protein